MAYFSVVGEGVVDLALARKVLAQHNHSVVNEYDRGGKNGIDASLKGYANASRQCNWLVLRDLNSDALCAPELLNGLFPNKHQFPDFHLRIAVREIEAWILGDRAGWARFLGIAAARVPIAPETLVRPKETLVQLASQSRHRFIREGLVPREGSGRRVGPEYNSILVDFIKEIWSLDIAIASCNSLARLVHRVAAVE